MSQAGDLKLSTAQGSWWAGEQQNSREINNWKIAGKYGEIWMDLDNYGSSSHPSWWHLRGLDMFWHIPSPVSVQLGITPSNKQWERTSMPRNPWFQPPKRLDEEIYFDQWCYHGPTACGLTLKGQMCLQDFHGASIFVRIWICLKMGAPFNPLEHLSDMGLCF